ncbi:YceI family protein [Chitiniphilus purpureus]|uniref:YceI family protein n=1 Tax=Chitiniphilus purpureus TaxID=2981137 RepID=A0ABY6DRP1_9NEIS|nr:YceI family protein [Chitiniphilus sp. CD1]UXY16893.1 YceI family protein [Chitiniphilus sp. CD1]
MKPMIASLLAMLAAGAVAAPQTYEIDSTHTYPSFEISHLGFSIQRGGFDKTSGTIVLDTEKKSGNVEIVIDTASIDTGLDKRDAHLRGEDFFNTAQFPTATFKSGKLKFSGDKLTAIDGEFTLLGVTKPLTLAVSNFKCGTHPMSKKPWCGAEATGTLKRTDFGMSYGVPGVGDEVKLNIQVEAGLK